MRGRNDSRYEQFWISHEMIEQELRPVVLNSDRQTDRFKKNYSIDANGRKQISLAELHDTFLCNQPYLGLHHVYGTAIYVCLRILHFCMAL